MNPPPLTSESLYRTFQERLRRFILKRVHDSAAADDILQDVFVKIHTRADTLQDETKLESWIFQITRNTIIDHYRSQGKTDSLDSSIDPAQEDPLDEAHQRLATTVRSFIDQLPPLYRDALVLVEYEGMSQSAVAAKFGISLSGAKSRVQRARAMLRDLLMQCCHFEFDQYGTVMDYHSHSCTCCAQENRPENKAKDCC
jgi:RNA polymerase sigma-70 factor (ECF subfamily)